MGSAASEGPLASVRQAIEAQPRRTRILLAVLLVLLGVVWMAGLWWWTSSSLTAQADDLASRQRTLNNLQVMMVKYRDAEQQIREAEQRLGGSAGENPSSYIEKAATQHGVRESLRGIEKMTSETRGNLQETRYRVSLSRAPLEGTMKLLYDVETAGFLSVENASIKTVFSKGDRLLNTTLDLVAYELVTEE
jgi:cytoskeletal protein RodZ